MHLPSFSFSVQFVLDFLLTVVKFKSIKKNVAFQRRHRKKLNHFTATKVSSNPLLSGLGPNLQYNSGEAVPLINNKLKYKIILNVCKIFENCAMSQHTCTHKDEVSPAAVLGVLCLNVFWAGPGGAWRHACIFQPAGSRHISGTPCDWWHGPSCGGRWVSSPRVDSDFLSYTGT